MRPVIIGVDPGLVTGVARYVPPDVTQHCGIPLTWDVDTYERLAACDRVRRELDMWDNIIIAVERFTLGRKGVMTAQPDALMIIGALEWLVYERNLRVPGAQFVIQGAADAAHAAPRDVLTRLGWWIPGDRDQQRNKASAQVALALLMHEPKLWQSLLENGACGIVDQVDR